MDMPLRIALTPGEPAGIGPDLAVMLAQYERRDELVVIADPELLATRAKQLGLRLLLREFNINAETQGDAAGSLCVQPLSLASSVDAGVLDACNSPYVIKTLETAVKGCLDNTFAAMVTAPVHKGIVNDAGIPFSGHTEFIAAITSGYPVMMLVTQASADGADKPLRVALASTHIPISAVPAALTQPGLEKVLTILHSELQQKFGIAEPHILVCGLNPHAGEGGHLGREEIEVITPAISNCQRRGFHISGPLPADTLFTPHYLEQADAVLAMFHDQGLPVLKYAGFGSAINLTLGLPIIRTSVDHGTAIDLAGSGKINDGSLRAALALATQLCRH